MGFILKLIFSYSSIMGSIVLLSLKIDELQYALE